jgi:hypothetical protein
MSLFRRGMYLREQQRETKHAPRVFCRGPHIRNFEKLCRIIYSPENVRSDNSFKPESISRKDLTERGFSIQRVKYTDRTRIDQLTTNYTRRKVRRAVEYLLLFLGEDVRRIKDGEGYQAFIIVDDAQTPEDKGHALILCAEKHKPSKVKELRQLLADAINKPKQIDAIFPH